jgi:uncharacterized protein YbjT (DUF2867 family)
MANKTALLIGATGLVGEQCLQQLLESTTYDKVIAVTRKKLSLENSKLHNVVMDFDKPEAVKDSLRCDDVYCAIGTTIKKSGSKDAFRKVDYEYPLHLAQLCLSNGAKRFILVSSLGADAQSGVFYSRVKGELEEALKKLNYETLIILRPSILLGNRKEQRPGEAIARFVAEKFSFLFAGPLKQYRGTPVNLLARVMIKTGTSGFKGIRVLENNDIFSESV